MFTARSPGQVSKDVNIKMHKTVNFLYLLPCMVVKLSFLHHKKKTD